MNQIANVWNRLSLARKIIAVAATAGSFFAILAMARLAAAPSMVLLYAGLEPAAAGEVIQNLEARGVVYDVRGGAIYVGSEERDQLRMSLAGEGLPANGSSGYELLDSLNGFGTTSQMFNAAYWRAKEGELARTIASSPHIRTARVHIAAGKTTPFQRGTRASASVLVTPMGGDLSAARAEALQYLVASAVAGLSAEDVTIVGSDGALIRADDKSTHEEQADKRASMLKNKVERLLEARVGPGNAVVEVSVDTETEQEAIRERRYDPDGRVAISTDTEETSRSETNAAGQQVTVASNLPDGDAAGGESGQSQDNQTRERVNYEVSETEREIIRIPGATKRITVAVLVNGTETLAEDGTVAIEPRNPDEIEALRELVSSAVGYDEARGDVITIKSMSLARVEPLGTSFESSIFDQADLDIFSMIKMAVLAIVAMILGLFVIRPILAGKNAPAGTQTALPAPDGSGVKSVASPDAAIPDDGLGLVGEIALPEISGPDLTEELPGLPVVNDPMPTDPAARLRHLIGERQSETVEILRNWLEDEEELA